MISIAKNAARTLIGGLFVASLALATGCDGDAEEAGENIDDAVEEVGDEIEDATDK